MGKKEDHAIEAIRGLIVEARGQRVILDEGLARLYGVETRRLNEQVRRNRERFPPDFAFPLAPEEVAYLKSQSAISSGGHGGRRRPPLAFTEHGALMAANVLRSPEAVEMSVFVVRAFVQMREQLTATRELARRLARIEKKLVLHDASLADLYRKIRPLLLPPADPPRKQIGFQAKEQKAAYTTGKGKGAGKESPGRPRS